MAAVFATSDVNTLNDAERAFLAGVFAYQGVHNRPTEDEFRLALKVRLCHQIVLVHHQNARSD
jgi:hypothetical protein